MLNQRGFTLLELMLTIFLSALLSAGVFQCAVVIENLYYKQHILSEIQNNRRYLTFFLREKIQSAGDWSCAPNEELPSLFLLSNDALTAKTQWGITVKPNTDLLTFASCVQYNNQLQYLPLHFFVADTSRIDKKHKPIAALYMQIDHHPREEVISDMTDFQGDIQSMHQKKLVKIKYALSGLRGVIYAFVRKTA